MQREMQRDADRPLTREAARRAGAGLAKQALKFTAPTGTVMKCWCAVVDSSSCLVFEVAAVV